MRLHDTVRPVDVLGEEQFASDRYRMQVRRVLATLEERFAVAPSRASELLDRRHRDLAVGARDRRFLGKVAQGDYPKLMAWVGIINSLPEVTRAVAAVEEVRRLGRRCSQAGEGAKAPLFGRSHCGVALDCPCGQRAAAPSRPENLPPGLAGRENSPCRLGSPSLLLHVRVSCHAYYVQRAGDDPGPRSASGRVCFRTPRSSSSLTARLCGLCEPRPGTRTAGARASWLICAAAATLR